MMTPNQKAGKIVIETENFIGKMPSESQISKTQESLSSKPMKTPDYSYGFNNEGIEYTQGIDNAPDPFTESLLFSAF